MTTPRYRGRRLAGPVHEFHAAVDQLEDDTVPESYYLQVMASRGQPTIEPPSAAVQVVENEPGRVAQGEMFKELPPTG
jgi:hypothetical protein